MSNEAFSYPLQAEHRLKTIGIGGLLHLFPVAILSLLDFLSQSITAFLIAMVSVLLIILSTLFLMGYWLRVLRSTAQGEETLPEFTDWSELLVNGLKWIPIHIVYLIPTLTLFAMAILVGWTGGESLSSVISFVAYAIGLGTLFFLPAALTNVALTGRLGAAFEVRNIGKAALSSQYFIGAVFVYIIYGFFNEIESVPIMIIGAFIQFYLLVVASYLIGSSCGPNLHEQHRAGAIAD